VCFHPIFITHTASAPPKNNGQALYLIGLMLRMSDLRLHNSKSLPTELIFPFSWVESSEEPKTGELGFFEGALKAFDGERWIAFDLADTLKGIRPSPKGFASEPLVKALGMIKHKPARVIDATCGTGKDSLQIWGYGNKILAFERHPMVYALLWDALRRVAIPNFELRNADASCELFNSDDVVYFDPMFEHVEKKKSLARKEMQLFKNAVGADTDQSEVLERLLKSGCGRVVVKRPIKLESHPKPNHSIEGKTVKYDVYLPLLG